MYSIHDKKNAIEIQNKLLKYHPNIIDISCSNAACSVINNIKINYLYINISQKLKRLK